AVEVVEHRRELLHDVGEVEGFPVELLPALLADPEEGVLLVREPPPLQHQPHGVGWALRGVGDVGREEEELPFPDGDRLSLSIVQDLEGDVSLQLVEELLALVDVEVLPGIGPPHHGDHELPVGPDLLVAYRGPEQMAVFVDPLLEVEGLQPSHGAHSGIVAMHFSSIAIGVGSRVTSTVVRQGWASLKYSAHRRL